MNVKKGKVNLEKETIYNEVQKYVEKYTCNVIEKTDENYTECFIRVLDTTFYNVYNEEEQPIGGN